MAWHDELTGDDAIHEIMYVQTSDPGAVGANKFWLDTTGGATMTAGAILKQRDGSNASWTTRADVKTALDLKATLASPTFTGTPAAPTASPGTNSTQLATTAYVDAAAAAGGAVASVFGRTGTVAATGGDYTQDKVPAAVVAKTANYTATSTDNVILCDAVAGGFTITLPAAASHTGRIYEIKKSDTSVNAVTIDGNGSETIDGATTLVLSAPQASVRFISNGTSWFTVAKGGNSNAIIVFEFPEATVGDLVTIPYLPAGVIGRWDAIARPSGSVEFGVKVGANVGALSSITATNNPAITSSTDATDTTLTSWTKGTSAGDRVEVEIISVSTSTYVALALVIARS